MLNLLAIPAGVLPVVIFFLRVTDMSLDTLRVLFVIRGRKPLAWILGSLLIGFTLYQLRILKHVDFRAAGGGA